MKKYMFFIMLIFSVVSFGEAWSSKEISIIEFEEMDGVVVLSFKDAVDTKPVVDARVEILGMDLKTDYNGYVRINQELVDDIEDAKVPIIVKKKGYIDFKSELEILMGTVKNKKFLMSKKINLGNIRFVLVWGDKPIDLDLHLVGENFHVSYRKKENSQNYASLDRDDITGFGPETITLKKAEWDKKYRLYVNRYSNERKYSDDGYVYIYANNFLERIVKLPETNGRIIKVLEISEKKINYINKVTNNIY